MIPVHPDNYFDVADALYWFCVHYHNGQWSPLYSVQCQIGFTPSPCANGPEEGEALDVYETLSELADQDYDAAVAEAERLLGQILCYTHRADDEE